MYKLLALIDGSIYSTSVCEHAGWMANRMLASVEILHVLGRRHTSSEPANLSGSIGLGARTALLEELTKLDAQTAKLAQKRGRILLEDAKAHVLAAKPDLLVDTRMRHGEMIETLQETEASIDLIIIGKRGEAADFDSLHLGSNLERVVRSVHKPVLVVSRAFKPVSKIMIAFDGGASAGKAVATLAKNQWFKNISCELLTVGKDNTQTRRNLEGANAMLTDAGYSVSHKIIDGHAESVIAEQVDANNIDLLVIGAYGHSRIRNLIIGSTTTQMIRSCKVPVLLFR